MVRGVAQGWGAPPAGHASPLLLYCELRVVAADDLWLSQNTMADGGDALALAFGMNKHSPMAVKHAAAEMERALAAAGVETRPHWSKLRCVLLTQLTDPKLAACASATPSTTLVLP